MGATIAKTVGMSVPMVRRRRSCHAALSNRVMAKPASELHLVPCESVELAQRLGVSHEAVQLTRTSEVIDLHIDTFIPVRLFGYSLWKRHQRPILPGVAFGHLDLPRVIDGGLSGAMWSITTNPFRTARARWRVFQSNLERLRGLIDRSGGLLRVARTAAEYRAVRASGAHACLVAVQGGNCFDATPSSGPLTPDRMLTRVTVLHLTNSSLGASSSPLSHLRRRRGLTAKGKELVERLNEERVFVDLAHIHPDGFWDAVDAHDRSQPLLATHTGVTAVAPHWRNLDDRQVAAIADTGGVVGIIFSAFFLDGRHGHQDAQMVVEHMQHVVDTVGEDFVGVGSDYDGAIVPPRDLRSGDSYARVVQAMLDRGWKEDRIRKILGLNFLRAFEHLRP